MSHFPGGKSGFNGGQWWNQFDRQKGTRELPCFLLLKQYLKWNRTHRINRYFNFQLCTYHLSSTVHGYFKTFEFDFIILSIEIKSFFHTGKFENNIT